MSTELLEIQPRELKFVYELKKQSSCSVRLLNITNHYVAFKVKTTSPKKYCVRPNVGIVKPKSASEFFVTMQAPRTPTPDLTCKDKFLVQSSIVPFETTDEDITPSMFLKDDGKYVEERKLKVILVSPPNSPILSPINGSFKSVPDNESSKLKDQVLGGVENLSPNHRVSEVKMKHRGESELEKDVDVKALKDDDMYKKTALEDEDVYNKKKLKDEEETKLVKDMEEMKLKINLLDSKLREAETTICKLTEERRLTDKEKESLRHELALLRSTKGVKRVQAGFPLLFVCMVALISVVLGYRLHC